MRLAFMTSTNVPVKAERVGENRFGGIHLTAFGLVRGMSAKTRARSTSSYLVPETGRKVVQKVEPMSFTPASGVSVQASLS